MSMTNLSFILYFLPAMLVVYFILSFSVKAQNLWLVISSLAFYTLGNYVYVPLLVFMTGLNYFMARLTHIRRQKEVPIKAVVCLAVAANLLPLFIFRYLGPLMDSVLGLFGAEAPEMPTAPLGIAFLALQGISYVADIARGKVQWDKNPINACLYLVFFPFMQAGPLLRHHEVAAQLEHRKFHLGSALEGVCRLVVGLGKVIILGSPLLRVADIVFERSSNSGIYTAVPVSLALLGLAALTIGSYHYLSGFSDLVMGLGGILGFAYPENFNYPVLASSMILFWKRSYISMVAWFEEYVYLPLGKRRSNNDHMVLHLMIMWMLIGIWLGPGIPNIIFGFISFMVILIEHIVELPEKESKNPLRHLYVIFAVLLSLIALKSESMYQFATFIGNLFGMRNNGFPSEMAAILLHDCWSLLVVGLAACFPISPKLRQWGQAQDGIVGKVVYALYPVAMLTIVALLFIAVAGDSYLPSQLTHLYLWR